MVQPTPPLSRALLIAGVDYPRDLAEFRDWFATDEACADYLDHLRFPNGFCCPGCGCGDAGWEVRGRYRCHGCGKQVSVTAGTVFHRSRIPLTVWFQVMWQMSVNKLGVSATHLYATLPIGSYQSAWTMLAKLRACMSSMDSELLSGRVQVDETFIGGVKPGLRGRGALGKVVVAGAIEVPEHGWGRARLRVIPDASTPSLRAFLTDTVASGSLVVTDGWLGYRGAVEGYRHEHISLRGTDSMAHEVFPAVHRLFSQVKRMIEGTYQGSVSSEHLQEYLDEDIFRFNHRHADHRSLIFARLAQRAVTTPASTYRDLPLISQPKPEDKHPTGVSGPRRKPGTMQASHHDRPWRQKPH